MLNLLQLIRFIQTLKSKILIDFRKEEFSVDEDRLFRKTTSEHCFTNDLACLLKNLLKCGWVFGVSGYHSVGQVTKVWSSFNDCGFVYVWVPCLCSVLHLSIYRWLCFSASTKQTLQKLFVFESSSVIHERNLAKGTWIIEGTVFSNTQIMTDCGVLRPRFPFDLSGHFVHCCIYRFSWWESFNNIANQIQESFHNLLVLTIILTLTHHFVKGNERRNNLDGWHTCRI